MTQDSPIHPAPGLDVRTTCLVVLTTIACAGALYWLRPVMIPLVLALFLTIALAPVVGFLVGRLHLPRSVAVVATLALGFLVLAAIGALISNSVSQLTENADAYEQHIDDIGQWLAKHRGFEQSDQLLTDADVPGLLLGTLNAVFDLLSNGFLVLIFMFFLLLGRSSRRAKSPIAGEIEHRVRRFLVAKVSLSALTGLLVGGILMAFGVDLALVFGLLAFLLNFIPNIGSMIASLLPVPIVLLSPELSVTAKVLAIVLPATVQFVVGNVLEPKLMGESLDLHPIVILIALIVWGMLWGLVGMLLAMPLTAALKIVLERIEAARPIAELLGGRLPGGRGEPESGT